MSDLKPEQILKARQEGRMEALAIILREDAESPFRDQVICGPNDEAGDYSTYWNEEALRKLLHVDDNAYNAFDKAEEQYWDYRGYALECEIAATERRTQPEATAPAIDSQNPVKMENNNRSCSPVDDNAAQDLSAAILALPLPMPWNEFVYMPNVGRWTDCGPLTKHAYGSGTEVYTAEQMRDLLKAAAALASSANALSAGDREDAERDKAIRKAAAICRAIAQFEAARGRANYADVAIRCALKIEISMRSAEWFPC